MQQIFEGIWVPIITPFQRDQIDHPALVRLSRHLFAHGVAGLVVGATTGEGALLAQGEIECMFATLREAVPTLPLVLGLSHASTQSAVARARSLAALRPDGLLVTSPVYVRPTQQGIQRHFEVIVETVDIPVLIYNIPYRTGVNVELETLQMLARDPRVVGIKECGGSMDRMLRLIHETPLRVFCGDDNQIFSSLCLGAHGAIAASAHILPDWHVRMRKLLNNGQLIAARRIAVALQPITRTLFEEPNPSPLKSLLAQQGWCENGVRLPFVTASSELVARLLSDWNALQLQCERIRHNSPSD